MSTWGGKGRMAKKEIGKESITREILRFIALIVYYGFARYLPNFPNFRIGQKVRGFLCRLIFRKCGKNINVERMAYFGLGKDIEIGSNSGIGKRAYITGIGGWRGDNWG